MESQDVITYTQPIVKVIEDEKAIDVMKDTNLIPVLRFLRKGPMTINDLVDIFKKKGDQKSDKTIYRYLQAPVKAKLVAKATVNSPRFLSDNLKGGAE